MKKIIFTSLFICVFLFIQAQTIIKDPEMGIKNTGYLEIPQIELNDTATIISFYIKPAASQWIAVHPKTYIQPVGQPTQLGVIKAEGIEIDKKVTIPENEGLTYKLFFPKIDPMVSEIDFMEPMERGWKIFNIRIKKLPYNALIPEQLLGNWFSTVEGNKWELSFLDSLAVCDSKVWEYSEIKKIKNVIKISLKAGDDEKVIFTKVVDDNNCLIGGCPETMRKYSHAPNSFKHAQKIDSQSFTDPILERDTVYYSGYIKGYTTRIGVKTGIIRAYNRLESSQESHLIKIADNGTFSVKFALDYPQMLQVKLPAGDERIYFEPGKSVFHLINSGINNLSSLFMGESGKLNNDLQATTNIRTSRKKPFEGIVDMSPKQYMAHIASQREKELELLKAHQKGQYIGNKAIQIRKLDIEYRAASQAIMINPYIRLATYYKNSKLPVEEKIPYKSVNIDISLLKFISNTPVDHRLALISSEYLGLLGTISRTDFSKGDGLYYHLMNIVAKKLNEKGIELTQKEADMFDYIKANLLQDYSENNVKDFRTVHGETLRNFREKNKDVYSQVSNQFYTKNSEKNLESIFGISDGLPFDIITLQNAFRKIKTNPELISHEEYKKTKQSIKTDFLKEFFISKYYQSKAKVENLSSESASKTDGDKLFDSILNKFRGKIVYVDFWATWCGPCRSGIQKIKPLKDELENENIVFVYITNETSPEKTWEEMISTIKGEHFRVSKDEWNYLTQKFNISGIPHYALVDKTGKVVNPHLRHMDNEPLKKLLMEQLNK